MIWKTYVAFLQSAYESMKFTVGGDGSETVTELEYS